MPAQRGRLRLSGATPPHSQFRSSSCIVNEKSIAPVPGFPMKNVLPTLRGLIVCEKLIVEQGTGNITPINCHASRLCDRFPTLPLSMAVYGLLANGLGTCMMKVKILRLDTNEEIFQRILPMIFTDRLKEVNFVYRLNDAVFPVEGRYDIGLWAEQELMGLTSLQLKLKR